MPSLWGWADASGPRLAAITPDLVRFFWGGHQAVAKALAGHLSDVNSDHYTPVPMEILAAAMEVLPRLVP